MKGLFLFVLVYLLPAIVCGQNPIGLPEIINYSNTTYKGGIQNWDIQQDSNGVMYFANNDGLLTFNGRFWKLYPLPNKTIIRSVKINAEGKIYVGGQDEIGYFLPDQNGILHYTSLKALIPEKQKQFSDIWDIVVLGEQVFFRTVEKVFQLKDHTIHVYPSKEIWDFIGKADNKLYAQIRGKGIFYFKNNKWELVNDQAEILYNTITAILPYDENNLLITTLKSGLFLFDDQGKLTRKVTPIDNLLKNARIFCALKLADNKYAFGTTSAACLIIDRNGKLVQRFSFNEGVQKNNIRSIFVDRHQNLWLGLDDGIDFIAYDSPLRRIFPDKNKQVTGYSTRIYNNTLYLGTSNGLFATSLNATQEDISYSSETFQEVANTAGQVWSITEINNKLLLGHEDGAFVVEKQAATPIYSHIGTWLFQPVSSVYPVEGIISGTYNGLHYIQANGGQFREVGAIAGLQQPLRFIHFDQINNTVWSSHPYRGVYMARLTPDRKKIQDLKLFTDQHGLPSILNNFVFYVKSRLAVATEKGIYEYHAGQKKFIPSAYFQDIFKQKKIQYLKEDPEGNIWFVSDNQVGVVDFKRKTDQQAFAVVYFPELNSKLVAGFEHIYPYDAYNVFVGANKGVYHINYDKYIRNTKQLNVLLTEVRLLSKPDSVIYGGYPDPEPDNQIRLKNSLNSLRFEFSSTLFEQHNTIEFSYKLEGFDKTWSEWSAKSEKDYTNLSHGDYTFKVKARNNLGSETKEINYIFTVLPAWYESNMAYLLYFLMIALGIYALGRWQTRKHKAVQVRLMQKHQFDLEKSENEIIRLQNEKLENEVGFKNKELAITTLHLTQRGKLLLRIKEELYDLQKAGDSNDHYDKIKKLIRLLDDTEKSDADWNQFALHFDQLHNNFLNTLKQKFPHLSQNDLKTCAYLKMNLSSKEIAQLLGITIRGVEVSRYRLRKKLQITSEVNLFDYLLQVTKTFGES
jgi:DNA-binding CsgD family transcriptional regulator